MRRRESDSLLNGFNFCFKSLLGVDNDFLEDVFFVGFGVADDFDFAVVGVEMLVLNDFNYRVEGFDLGSRSSSM